MRPRISGDDLTELRRLGEDVRKVMAAVPRADRVQVREGRRVVPS